MTSLKSFTITTDTSDINLFPRNSHLNRVTDLEKKICFIAGLKESRGFKHNILQPSLPKYLELQNCLLKGR